MLVLPLFVQSDQNLFPCANVFMRVVGKLKTETHMQTCLCCITVSLGVKFCSLKASPFQVQVCETPITLLSFSANLMCVCECPCIQLFLAELIKPPILSPALSSSPRSTHTHTHMHTCTYIFHALFIGLNDRGDSFPCGKRGGTSCQHGPLHLPSLTGHTEDETQSRRENWKLETQGDIEVAESKADHQRVTRERWQRKLKIKHLIALNKLSPLSYSEIPVCLKEGWHSYLSFEEKEIKC